MQTVGNPPQVRCLDSVRRAERIISSQSMRCRSLKLRRRVMHLNSAERPELKSSLLREPEQMTFTALYLNISVTIYSTLTTGLLIAVARGNRHCVKTILAACSADHFCSHGSVKVGNNPGITAGTKRSSFSRTKACVFVNPYSRSRKCRHWPHDKTLRRVFSPFSMPSLDLPVQLSLTIRQSLPQGFQTPPRLTQPA